MAKKGQVTKYSKLVSAASKNCRLGTPASKKAFENAKKRYIADAQKKGKSMTEIRKVVARLSKCKRK